jgi:hypothetical protein
VAQVISEPQALAQAQPPDRPDTGMHAYRGAVLVSVVVLALSTAIVVWARTRPGFDPFGWLVWGRQTVAGALNTNAAPSWKPLPYLFTLPYGVFGHAQLWLWMITAVAVALSGVVFAARIAYRLTAAPAGRRYAAVVAGAFAGITLLGIRDYWHYILSAQSDPMIVALCLAAIDAHLCRRPRLAYGLGCLAALGRPEVWPFLAVYAVWLWLRRPEARWIVAAGVGVLVLLWFGIPALTSRSAFVAGTNALGSGRALHGHKITGTIDRFLDMHETALELAALLSVVLAAVRRDRVALALAVGVVAWVVVEIAFALHGWPGLTRYMFEAGAVMVVIAGAGIGRLLAEPPRLTAPAGLVGAALTVAVIAGLLPAAVSRARTERRDLRAQRARTTEINRLEATINRLGGAARINRCGEPVVLLEYQTILAWTLHINVARIGWKLAPALRSGRPLVVFTPRPHGWRVRTVHQRHAACRFKSV